MNKKLSPDFLPEIVVFFSELLLSTTMLTFTKLFNHPRDSDSGQPYLDMRIAYGPGGHMLCFSFLSINKTDMYKNVYIKLSIMLCSEKKTML
jgi:hypothetical protein